MEVVALAVAVVVVVWWCRGEAIDIRFSSRQASEAGW